MGKIIGIDLGTSIYDADKYNQSSNAQDKFVQSFKLKETMRVTNGGDTIIDIKLNPNIVNQDIDKILIKGQSTLLIQAPNRPIAILR